MEEKQVPSREKEPLITQATADPLKQLQMVPKRKREEVSRRACKKARQMRNQWKGTAHAAQKQS